MDTPSKDFDAKVNDIILGLRRDLNAADVYFMKCMSGASLPAAVVAAKDSLDETFHRVSAHLDYLTLEAKKMTEVSDSAELTLKRIRSFYDLCLYIKKIADDAYGKFTAETVSTPPSDINLRGIVDARSRLNYEGSIAGVPVSSVNKDIGSKYNLEELEWDVFRAQDKLERARASSKTDSVASVISQESYCGLGSNVTHSERIPFAVADKLPVEEFSPTLATPMQFQTFTTWSPPIHRIEGCSLPEPNIRSNHHVTDRYLSPSHQEPVAPVLISQHQEQRRSAGHVSSVPVPTYRNRFPLSYTGPAIHNQVNAATLSSERNNIQVTAQSGMSYNGQYSATHNGPANAIHFNPGFQTCEMPSHSFRHSAAANANHSELLHPPQNPIIPPSLPVTHQVPVFTDSRMNPWGGMLGSVKRGFDLQTIQISSFNGDPLDYHRFTNEFDCSFDPEDVDPNERHSARTKLNKLISLCTGKARSALECCRIGRQDDAAYKYARDVLYDNYGRTSFVVAAFIGQLTDETPVDTTNLQMLIEASDQLQAAKRVLEQCDSISQVNATGVFHGILSRYPISFLNRFLAKHVEQVEAGIDPNFKDFVKFVKRETSLARSPLGRFINDLHSKKYSKNLRKTTIKVNATSAMASSSTDQDAVEKKPHSSCILCQGPHPLFYCHTFRRMSVDERRRLVEESLVCRNCLSYGHDHNSCPSSYRCRVDGCGYLHSSLLHDAFKRQVYPKSNVVASNNTMVPLFPSIGERSCPVRLSVVPVVITCRASSIRITTHAFLDSGATNCLCTYRLLDKLGISGEPVKCLMNTAAGTLPSQSEFVSISVQGIGESTVINLNDVLATRHFPDIESHTPNAETVAQCAHLKELYIPLIDINDVDLIIGRQVLMCYPADEVIRPRDNLPGAEHTVFGWCLGGSDKTLRTNVDSTEVNFLDCNNKISVIDDNFRKHCVPPALPMCSACNADFPDLDCDPYEIHRSVEDEQAIDIMKKTSRITNGRFQVGMLWKSDDVALPPNREAAVKSLETQRTKFMKDPELFQKYNEKINDYLSRGYAQAMPSDILPPTNRTFYLIHFHTKQKKMRIVFDASRKFAGKSLNSQLLSGPDINSSLIGVLSRFRMHRYPWAADLAQMFSRIQTYPRDSDSLRFLWFENNDIHGNIVDFQMTSHVFGSTCSPAIAQFCLRQIVALNGTNADAATLDCILKSMYVDDCVSSQETVELCNETIKQLRSLFANYGFNLTKFVSNDARIMSQIPESDRAPNFVNLDFENSNSESTLGVIWNVAKDTIQVSTKLLPKPITRRGIASQIAQVYTPFGYLAPFLLPAKLILQESTRLNLEWDAPVESTLKSRWVKWTEGLKNLEDLSFPRCYKPPDFNPVNIQLHNFADASKIGYSACSYFRFEDANGKIHLTFVRGISRVTPKNAPSIPRLELTAALTCVKLSRGILKDIDYKIDSVHYWTDSTAVLQCIKSTTSRFHTFVHEILLKIRSLTRLDQWNHVESALNPADIGSRGLMPDQLKRAKVWFNGPEFLLQPPRSWMHSSYQECELSQTEFHREIICASDIAIVPDTMAVYLESFSSLNRLVRSTAWILRLRAILHWKSKGSPDDPSIKPDRGFLTVKELDTALREVIRLCQSESFTNVTPLLTVRSPASEPIDKKCIPNALAKLIPFVCNGVMLVGGRLNQSDLPDSSKNPMVLPFHHHVTRLIIEQCHVENGHCGTLHVLSILRKKFWVVKGQTTIRKVLKKCLFCQCRRATPGCQYMADLPKCRITPGKNVFHYTMVDYFGPLICRRNRSQVKRYGCVFTCLCTRAVHLEVVDSLESSAFLMAFSKFIEVRGRPAHMFSDNGTAFVGAQKELGKSITNLNVESVASALAAKNIQWHFSPALAPHFQGAVERIVQSCKRILHGLNNNAPYHDNTLSALLYGVARILNDRPLTPVSNDIGDLQCLTPNSILLGRLDPSLPSHVFNKADEYAKNWKYVQHKLDLFWGRWLKEYLPQLQARSKWLKVQPNFRVGNIVLLNDTTVPRGRWPKGVIEHVFPDRNGLVRRVKVRTACGIYERDIRKLCRLELS